jgi:hypothetical protein
MAQLIYIWSEAVACPECLRMRGAAIMVVMMHKQMQEAPATCHTACMPPELVVGNKITTAGWHNSIISGHPL